MLLLAAANTASQTSSNSSSSASIGLGISFGSSGMAFGVTASASAARGNADGNDVYYTNTQVGADTVSIQSGGDTALRGAVVKANEVNANVGANLVVQSLQDSSTYQSQDQSISASGTAGMGASASLSASQSNINSNYLNVGEQSATFGDKLLKNVTNNLAGSAIDAAINGKPFDEKALTNALTSALITTGMAQGANAIGDAKYEGDINSFTQKMAHAVLGCAGGAATVGNMSGCGAGAVGAVVGEMAAEYYLDSHQDNGKTFAQNKADALAFAKVMSATAGVIAGGGGDNAQAVNVAATAGGNAAENNYLNHAEATARAALQEKQRKGTLTNAESKQLENLDVLDIARDMALRDACKTSGSVCDAARRDLNTAIASYAGAAAMANARLGVAGNASVTTARDQAIALSNDPKLASQTLWDSFKEFAVPQVAGYLTGAALSAYIAEAQVLYTAVRAETNAVAAGTAADAVAIAKARVNNNFYAEGSSSNPVGLTTSAGVIPPNPTKTTTVLGRYAPDMQSTIETQMQAPKSQDFGARPGGFNVLNVDDATANAAGSQFFEKINKPFLDAAVKRGDDVALATVPAKMDDVMYSNGALKGNFAKELDYLVKNNYKPVNISQSQWETIKGWFK